MKYAGISSGMWLLFSRSFEKQLCIVFNLDSRTAKTVMSKAKDKYKEIIAGLPEFEKSPDSSIKNTEDLVCHYKTVPFA